MPSGNCLIALISEKKNPPDRRVAFTPEQCLKIQSQYPQIRFLVEPSAIRCIPDQEYANRGIEVNANVERADILFGIKEVPAEALIEGKTYFFFSHTIKKQAYNQKLLQTLLEKKIEMVDYECLLDEKGGRTVAFGRFAGIVGAYNGLRMWLQKKSIARLPPASDCLDMAEMQDTLRPFVTKLNKLRIAITGTGRVGSGAVEVLENLGIRQLSPEEYLNSDSEEPVFTVLSSRHYYSKKGEEMWNESDFRKNPEEYQPDFSPFFSHTDILIPCHFWNPKAPLLFSMEDLRLSTFRIAVISDVTCDIKGSIPTTLRSSSIASPFYDVEKQSGIEAPAFSGENNLTVCAVDNLPCELPLDASLSFGEMLMSHIVPEIASGERKSISGATICRDGKLCSGFAYLQDYADGKR